MTERSRWSDREIDALEERVDDAEDELKPLRPIPSLVAQHERRFDRMRDDELRRSVELREDLRGLERRLEAKLERAANGAAAKVEDSLNVNWKSVGTTLLAAGTGIGAPIAAALLLAPG